MRLNKFILSSFSTIVWWRRILWGYFCSPGLQTVGDYLTTLHPFSKCPQDLLLRGYLFLCEGWSLDPLQLQLHSYRHPLYPELLGDSQGKSSPGQQHIQHKLTWQDAVQDWMLKQNLTGFKWRPLCYWSYDGTCCASFQMNSLVS